MLASRRVPRVFRGLAEALGRRAGRSDNGGPISRGNILCAEADGTRFVADEKSTPAARRARKASHLPEETGRLPNRSYESKVSGDDPLPGGCEVSGS
ncbi:MAG: hypothetical protein AVDCRST_MAG89-4827 [uncultured Gemmatimonadetes bacterium]|uniref:Uncharacterized protein n=1 Tax=uncultured Gemmatimonadota bacterium TaxID=203437 RepID=A0A6J4N3C1_9BACT|nr:MAG: hypothetical protein AVDCRST_MAG89-4827 [uncultured Gemmatimonadota bacterium]